MLNYPIVRETFLAGYTGIAITQGGCKALGCFVRGDSTARVELINRYVLTKSLTWAMSGAYFRVWYGLLSDSEDSKVPLNRSSSGEQLPATHTTSRSQTVGKTFRDVISSTSGNDPKLKGILNVQVFHGGRILYLEGDRDECAPDAVLANKATHVHRAELPYHSECNAPRSHSAVIGNMVRFIYRGLKHMVDVITGDANPACNKQNNSQLVSHPEISAITLGRGRNRKMLQ